MKGKFNSIIACAVFLLITASSLHASHYPEEYSKKNLTRFILSLTKAGEWNRAGIELSRFASYYPGHMTPCMETVSRNYFLYMDGEYNLIKKNPLLSSEDCPVDILYFDALVMGEDYDGARKVSEGWEIDGYRPFKIKRKLMISLLGKEIEGAESALKKIKDYDKITYKKYKEIPEKLENERFDYKSPALASLLGVVPGWGYWYGGDSGTGLMAFILIALDSAVTYFAFRTGNRAIGTFTGIIGTFFYGGSIIGGYMAAKKYNRRVKNYTRDYLYHEMDMRNDPENIFKEHGVIKDEL